jgi:mannose-1-phosphate guanylyltransferase
VWIGDRPQIDLVLDVLARSGVPRAVVNTHHLAEQFDDAWVGARPLPVTRSFEPEILGTAGGIENAAGALGDGDILVWNADILADLDVRALVRAHRAARSAATLAIVGTGPPGRGTVGVDASGSLARIRAARRGVEERGADYAGIAILGPALRARLPEQGCLVGDVLVPWLAEGFDVHTFDVGAARVLDVGSLEAYLEANLVWLSAHTKTGSFVASSARVAEGIELVESVVLDGAVVEGAGMVERCVVWPGARATAPCARSIVTLHGIVPVPVGSQ